MTNLLIAIVAIVLIIAGPLATIASLNTLFLLDIPFNVFTWMSVLWLALIVQGGVKRK